MAFRYKLSEIIGIDVIEEGNIQIIDLQMKYMRYQLIIDDEQRKQELIKVLESLTSKKPKEKPQPKMPSFIR